LWAIGSHDWSLQTFAAMRSSVARIRIFERGITVKLVFDVVNGQRKYHPKEEPVPSYARPQPKPEPHEIPGYRKDGTDRQSR
jgi:hypothetical protein